MLGLFDDIHELSPQGKFIGQLIIAASVIAGGLRIHAGYPAISIIASLFWFVAVTNALNILDNMDGLAAGIAFIAASSLWAYSRLEGPPLLATPAIILAGATAGFWIYNFNPAKIFMGDCGSLLLGFVLASLSIIGTWGAASDAQSSMVGYTGVSNIILVLVVPMAVLMIPLFDTALVSFTRVQSGISPFQGGRDHTSHRLVLLGFSESRTVLTLMAWAGIVSALVLYLSQHSAHGLLAVLSIVSIISLFFGIFLTNLNSTVYTGDESNEKTNRNAVIWKLLLNKKQMLQAIVDTILITVSYLSAYLLKYEGIINDWNLDLIEKSLPLIIPVKLAAFWGFGLYRGQWRFVSVGDLWQIIKAVTISSLIIIGILLFLYRFEGFSRVVFLNDAMLTLLLIGGVRMLLRLFKEYFSQKAEQRHETPILIVGAGDGGDLFLRELRKNPHHDYLPVGFIDDDPAKKGQIIHGVKVLGDRKSLATLIKRHGIKEIFVAIMSATEKQLSDYFEISKSMGVTCRRVRPLFQCDCGNNKEPLNNIRKKNNVVHLAMGVDNKK